MRRVREQESKRKVVGERGRRTGRDEEEQRNVDVGDGKRKGD